MIVRDVLDICKKYNNAGWAVQEQLDKIVEAASCGGYEKDSGPSAFAENFAREFFEDAFWTVDGEDTKLADTSREVLAFLGVEL